MTKSVSIHALCLALLASCFSANAFVVPSKHSGMYTTTSTGLQNDNSKLLLQDIWSLSPLRTSKPSSSYSSSSSLMASANDEESNNLPFWFDPNTKGGALFLSLVLFVVPIIGYGIVTNVFGVDGIEAGKWIGVGFTAILTVVWVATYIFRVATKDMTYVSFFFLFSLLLPLFFLQNKQPTMQQQQEKPWFCNGTFSPYRITWTLLFRN